MHKISQFFVGCFIYLFLATVASMIMMCYVGAQTKDKTMLHSNRW